MEMRCRWALMMVCVLLAGSLPLVNGSTEIDDPSAAGYGPNARLLPPFYDGGVDTNSSGRFEYLAVYVNVSVLSRGNFMVTAEYASMMGPGTSNSTVSFLENGTHTITVYLEGVFFNSTGTGGPYTLGITLEAVNMAGSRSLDTASYTTRAYAASEFEENVRDVHLSGTIRDGETGAGVTGAVGILVPNRFWGLAMTDPGGNFSTDIPSGKVLVLGMDLGSQYTPSMRIMGFASGSNVTFDIDLYRAGLPGGNLSGRVTNVSGSPIEGVDIAVLNLTSGFSLTTSTDASGNYTLSPPNGSYDLVFSIDRYYSNVSRVTVSGGDIIVSPVLKPSPDIDLGTLTFNLWDGVSMNYTGVTFSTGVQMRYQADMLGNRDGQVNTTEMADLIDIMFSLGGDAPMEITTFDSFHVDDVFYDPVPGSLAYSIETVPGGVFDARAPVYFNLTEKFRSNQSIQPKSEHLISLNQSYGGDSRISLPSGFVMSGSNHSANASVSGTSLVTVHMAPDPDTKDNIDSEWVEITASSGGLQGFISGVVKDGTGTGIDGVNITADGTNDTTDPQGRFNISLAPGTYTVTASRAGYSTERVNGVVVLPGRTTTVDIVLKAPPDPPANLKAVGGDSQVNLSWDAPAYDGGSPITGYNIYRGISAGNLTLLTSTNSTRYTDTSLTNDRTYYYAVSAVNIVGESGRSSEVSATPSKPPSVPAPPTELKASAGDGYVDLTWAASTTPGVTYSVYRSTTPGTGYTLVASGITGTSYRDTTVSNGVTYYYVVRAVSASGLESDPSNEDSATPQGSEVIGDTFGDVTVWAMLAVVIVVVVVAIILLLRRQQAPSEEEGKKTEDEEALPEPGKENESDAPETGR